MEKTKPIRKPRAKKEEFQNSNIDVVILENTEKDIENEIVIDNTEEKITKKQPKKREIKKETETETETEVEKEVKKEVKTDPEETKSPESKKSKSVIVKKKTKAEILKEEKLKESQRLNTLSTLISQEDIQIEETQPNSEKETETDTELPTKTPTKPSITSVTIPQQPNIRQPDKVYEYSTHIKKLYHLSDFHIQLYKRHNEYQEVFNNVLDYLKNEKKNIWYSRNNKYKYTYYSTYYR